MVRFIGSTPTRYFTESIRDFVAQVGKTRFLITGRLSGSLGIEAAIMHYGLDVSSGIPHIHKQVWTVPKGSGSPKAYFDLPGFSLYGDFALVVKMADDLHQSWRPPTSRARYCSDKIVRRTIKCAIAFCLYTVGIPGIYYGTEQGFDGSGGSHSYLRESMLGGPLEHSDLETDISLIAQTRFTRRYRTCVVFALRARRYDVATNICDKFRVKALTLVSIIAWSRILDDEELICVISTDDEATQTAWVTIDSTDIYLESLSVECVCSSDEGLEGKRFPIEDRNGKAVRLTADPGHYAIYRRV
ncbi:hypothetical protein LTR84_002327 [Exophiala bonariae]|uniref:Uncharacterized protein n=1 Tax=Exophiala bonariae TaxID=1690606 RepID=A0AAV9NAY6_9EURO|nr:hypothetical protein LTR84_002327 [Exophiala bonariae]